MDDWFEFLRAVTVEGVPYAPGDRCPRSAIPAGSRGPLVRVGFARPAPAPAPAPEKQPDRPAKPAAPVPAPRPKK